MEVRFDPMSGGTDRAPPGAPRAAGRRGRRGHRRPRPGEHRGRLSRSRRTSPARATCSCSGSAATRWSRPGILDGDYVVAHKQTTAKNGEIVIAGIPGEEATVKTWSTRGPHGHPAPGQPAPAADAVRRQTRCRSSAGSSPCCAGSERRDAGGSADAQAPGGRLNGSGAGCGRVASAGGHRPRAAPAGRRARRTTSAVPAVHGGGEPDEGTVARWTGRRRAGVVGHAAVGGGAHRVSTRRDAAVAAPGRSSRRADAARARSAATPTTMPTAERGDAGDPHRLSLAVGSLTDGDGVLGVGRIVRGDGQRVRRRRRRSAPCRSARR